MTMTNIESKTWLDRLPTEIIFETFNYLSSNDIIYTFFFFSQRFNNLLLQNQRYFTYLELSPTNSVLWRIILSSIGSQIKSLNISPVDLSFPLSLFLNLKSLIVSSPYGSSNEYLKLIFESNQFNNLHSFKIQQHKIFSRLLHNNYLTNQDDILKKVFNNQNSLKIFQCSLVIQSSRKMPIYGLKINFNLHSLTLVLSVFQDIYSLIEYTPNLSYLNITTLPFSFNHSKTIKKINVKLKQFYLKLVREILEGYGLSNTQMDFDEIMYGIKHFSLSSLSCLSLDLISVRMGSVYIFPFNSFELQQFLELMPELKQFHLYATLNHDEFNRESILRTFNNQFWSDHNWSFGMQDRYFYTLPFHFDHLYVNEFFNDVKSNNPEILKTNPRLWYNVKIVDLCLIPKYDLDFIKELKMKMPKLTTIILHDYFTRSSDEIGDLNKRAKVQFDGVTTVYFACGLIEDRRDWLIDALPNVKHLMSSADQLPSTESKLAPILDKRIEQLYVDGIFRELVQLAKKNYVYFSNVQHIHFGLCDYEERFERLADVVIETLKNFQKLKTLTIYRPRLFLVATRFNEADFKKVVDYLNLNEFMENYRMKCFQEYLFFSKKLFET